jgi:hypothetical protein
VSDIIELFEQIAENGHAPRRGCHLFGVGYDDALRRIQAVYLDQRFERGKSAEKFVVGPYGSGKTHFLRHLAEVAREMNCVTSEVALNLDLDPSQALMVYEQVARQVQVPGREATGIRVLMEAALAKVQAGAEAAGAPVEAFQLAWAAALTDGSFALTEFGRVAKLAAEAMLRGEERVIDATCRWLTGDVGDKAAAAICGTKVVPKAEQNLYGRRSLLSFLQFVRRAGFHGAVVEFDEADQGLQVDQAKLQRILSGFHAGINALADLENGAGLIVYAVTPQIVESMERFPALQQRVIDPGPGQGFFDGNTYAPKIDLTRRPDPREELKAIAERLVTLFFSEVPGAPAEKQTDGTATARQMAAQVADNNATSGARREVARQVCAMLLQVLPGHAALPRLVVKESEV